jgi:hypothetical protein
MIRIAVTQEAFDAIASTMNLGSVGYDNAANAKGERLIWLDRWALDHLRHLRGPGESYSDVILRVAMEVS